MQPSTHIENPDVILIGSGVMSANLGALLKRLEPALRIQVYEVTDELAQEASHGWNNAGTGHAGICELSYTPTQAADGTVDVSNAIKIFEQFEKTRQFWASAIADGLIGKPKDFINPVQHLSFVHGAKWVDYLRARHTGLAAHHFFADMAFSTDRATIGGWAPLLTENRPEVPIAATKMDSGTDVNFGAISRKLLSWLGSQDHCGIASNHRVVDLDKTSVGWDVTIRDLATGLRVEAGPVEATAAGNILLQLLASGEISSLTEGRKLLRASFALQVFEPRPGDIWKEKADRLANLLTRP